jgi:hypothetical protein
MDESSDLRSAVALGKRSGVAKSAIDRASRGENCPNLETVEQLAKAFQLKPWEMLRMLDPAPAKPNADWTKPLSKNQKALYQAATLLAGSIPDEQALAIAHLIRASVASGHRPDEHDASPPIGHPKKAKEKT